MNIKKIVNNVILILCTNIAFFINIKNNYNLADLKQMIGENLIAMLVITIFLITLNTEKKQKSLNVISIIIGFLLTLGSIYNSAGTISVLWTNKINIILIVLKFIGYCNISKILITMLYNNLPKLNKALNIKHKFYDLFNKRPFLVSFIIIIVCWLPYIISFYPGILSPDPSNQIKQFFNIPTHYIDGVNLIDSNVLMTNHHPVMQTILLGGSVKLGRIIGNENIGMFLYTLTQVILLSSVLAYTISYVKKLKLNNLILILMLSIYALVPVFPFYAMSLVKDTLFGMGIILYIITLFDLVNFKNKITIKKAVKIIILLLLIMLVRNNGIYTIILSFPFLFIVLKHQWKILLVIFILPILVYKVYDGKVLNYFKITQGSIREMLSIPFQQTARLALLDETAFSIEDKKIVDKVLTFDTLKDRYKPNISDPVKNQFNRNTNKEDMNKYFEVWKKGLLKRPDIYMDATLNNVYGYFYPNTYNWYIYYNYDNRLKESGFDYKYNNLSNSRNLLISYGISFPYIPGIGMIVNIGMNGLLVLIIGSYLVKDKKYKYLIYLTPALSLMLVCIASPVNTYFRYALPYVFSMPLMIAFYIKTKEREKEK